MIYWAVLSDKIARNKINNMPRNPNAKRRLLKALYDLKFATIYNLAFESRGATKDSCLVGTGRHITQLEKDGLVIVRAEVRLSPRRTLSPHVLAGYERRRSSLGL